MKILDESLDKAIDEVVATKNHDDVISYLKREHPGSPNTKCDVRHLWGNNYRINYWGFVKGESEIVDSKFVIVTKTKDGFITIVK